MGQVVLVICWVNEPMLSLCSRTLLTDLVLVALSTDLFRRPRPIGLSGLCRFSTLADTEDVRNDVSSACGASLCLVPQGDLDVRLALCIGVVLRILAQTLPKYEIIIGAGARLKAYLVDDKLVKLDLPSTDLLPDGGQVLVDVLYDDLRSLTGEDLVQDVTAAPFSVTSATRLSLHIPRNGLG